MKDGALVSVEKHETAEDYSSWLLPAVDRVLAAGEAVLRDMGMVAVAVGPGSFTGLRVGLTTAKAWAELHGTPIVGVSRLEAMARLAGQVAPYLAVSFDAQRGQLFGGLFRRETKGALSIVGEEMVVAPDEFVEWISRETGEEMVEWVGLDPDLVMGSASWATRTAKGEVVVRCDDAIAPQIAVIGNEKFGRGELVDALRLDANYVRRSDAEIFWKDPASRGK